MKTLIFISVIILSFLLYSCKENSVSPPQNNSNSNADSIVNLISPVNGHVFLSSDTVITLVWHSPAAKDTATDYVLNIAHDSLFNLPYTSLDGQSIDDTSFTFSWQFDPNIVYWRIAALFNHVSRGPWSVTNNFYHP